MKNTGIYEAWNYLVAHPLFGDGSADRLMKCLRINIILGNPDEKDSFGFFEVVTEEAGKEQVWIECGPYNPDRWLHDSTLDTAGETFEEALRNLSQKISETYGSVTYDSGIKQQNHTERGKAS